MSLAEHESKCLLLDVSIYKNILDPRFIHWKDKNDQKNKKINKINDRGMLIMIQRLRIVFYTHNLYQLLFGQLFELFRNALFKRPLCNTRITAVIVFI